MRMEIIYFDGAIVGLAQRIPCRVSAFRMTTHESWTDSEHTIVEDAKTDTLPDGDYDVQVDGRQIAFKRKDGKFSLRQ
jgi:hypothetical protein